jgi:phosphopantetheinyl transferase
VTAEVGGARPCPAIETSDTSDPVSSLDPVGTVDTVEVWAVNHPYGPVALDPAALALLSPAERGQAETLPSAASRRAFCTTRAALRTLLGLRLGWPPQRVLIGSDEHGKPILDGRPSPLHFNVSHAQGRSLIALARQPMGIDIEGTERLAEAQDGVLTVTEARQDTAPPSHPVPGRHGTHVLDRLAALILTDDERRDLGRCDRAVWPRRLLALWVRKEAVAKAMGLGLRFPFQRLDVRGPLVVVGPTGGPGEAPSWWCQDLILAGPYVAAVAIPRGPTPGRLRVGPAAASGLVRIRLRVWPAAALGAGVRP